MNKDAEIIGIWGGRGSGKTTRLKELIKGRDRVIVLDPIDGFDDRSYKTVRSFKELYKAIKLGWNRGFKIVFKTPTSEQGCIDVMIELRKALWLIQKPYKEERDNRKITLCLDEAHKYFPNYKLPDGRGQALEDIIALGRHYGIEMIAASQRLAKVWTEYRGNCSQHYFFRQGDNSDFTAVLSIIGSEFKADIRSLQNHEYLHKDLAFNITKGKNTSKFVK